MILTAEKLPEGKTPVRASPLAWRSSKLKRKVFSTFGGETQAMLQGVNEVDWLQVMYRDATKHDVQLSAWRDSLSPHMVITRGQCTLGGRQQQCSVTDAKSLNLLRENPRTRNHLARSSGHTFHGTMGASPEDAGGLHDQARSTEGERRHDAVLAHWMVESRGCLRGDEPEEGRPGLQAAEPLGLSAPAAV